MVLEVGEGGGRGDGGEDGGGDEGGDADDELEGVGKGLLEGGEEVGVEEVGEVEEEQRAGFFGRFESVVEHIKLIPHFFPLPILPNLPVYPIHLLPHLTLRERRIIMIFLHIP